MIDGSAFFTEKEGWKDENDSFSRIEREREREREREKEKK